MRYDASFRQFSIETNDSALVGDQQFSVRAHFANYPNMDRTSWSIATLTILDDCNITPILSSDAANLGTYKYTWDSPAVVFEMGSVNLLLSQCP